MSICIEQAISFWQIRVFICFCYKLYQGDFNYIFEFNWFECNFLGFKNFFFRYFWVVYFLVYNGKQMVGRVVVIYNIMYLERYQDRIGFFGFFDVVDDQVVCDVLFYVVGKWLASLGMIRIMGLENFIINYVVGIFIVGFE